MDELDRAAAAHRAGDFEAAERGYRAMPNDPRAMHNLAVLLATLHRHEEAETFFRRSLELNPQAGPPAFSLSMQMLARGAYAEAWPFYEGRRNQPGLFIPHVKQLPEWKGEPLEGKRLLVVGEQGFGDQIQFARFIPALCRQAKVTYLCSDRLVRLFAGQPFQAIAGEIGAPAAHADAWTLVGSLPLRLGITLGNLPPPLPLPVRWRGAHGGGVGVVVRGRPTHTHDAHRSLDQVSAERVLAWGRDLAPEATGARDFLETAQIIAGLDAVVTVDTAIAHLAASIGAPTWILLARQGQDWRWLRQGPGSPWYPSARLFRQGPEGGWAAVLDEVEAQLTAQGLR
ncbi:tetratricopeptide repeat protein [Phenylobacterium deserti]|uniref:Uncharacterized protein n=1 Tax=Phenylobacterium deserti TaxID=1914756 RepID=A0A328AQJ9_9CAUL|nr:tetratricopeptide repeat protein [Phenylobacterium deserti]RAK56849.1 hypothetical protein DJ018_02440 [Phenylobacterium deserti]